MASDETSMRSETKPSTQTPVGMLRSAEAGFDEDSKGLPFRFWLGRQ
jgi:hypothetical protein